MGCDIHLYVETKDDDGKWKSAEKWTREYDELDVAYDDKMYTGRNYRLFGALADVRNGWGFAGCDTGDEIAPISKPKGMPNDCDPLIQKQCEFWDGDGHSHSYLTLAELQAYDWNQEIVIRGYVSDEAKEELAKGKTPESWCGWTNASGFTQAEWRVSLASQVKPFLDVMKKLESLGEPENVRIVFWFDN